MLDIFKLCWSQEKKCHGNEISYKCTVGESKRTSYCLTDSQKASYTHVCKFPKYCIISYDYLESSYYNITVL